MKVSIEIPKDKNGMMGRECLECKRYFKIKPGTGLKTTHCYCPYCEYNGDHDTFWTEAQLEFAKSIAIKQAFDQVIKPALDKITESFRQLEHNSRNSFIKVKVETSGTEMNFPIKYYTEKELETNVLCNGCGLVFSVYKEFNNCPDCDRTNASLIFKTSLEIIEKRLSIITKPEVPNELTKASLKSILISVVDAFVKLGGELHKRKSDKYLNLSSQLFSDPLNLDKVRNNYFSTNLKSFDLIIKLFEVSKCLKENGGIVKPEIAKNVLGLEKYSEKPYDLQKPELEEFIHEMLKLSELIMIDYGNDILELEK